jgi:hypothetical protein
MCDTFKICCKITVRHSHELKADAKLVIFFETNKQICTFDADLLIIALWAGYRSNLVDRSYYSSFFTCS